MRRETNKEAVGEESKAEETESKKQEEKKLKEQTLNQTVSDINEYIKVNGKIDPETVELMAGTSLEDFLNNIESRENLKLELNLSQLKEEVAKSIETLEEPARENWWRKIVNKSAVKASFVALMLFLKFAPDAQASFNKDEDNVKDKTENVKDNQAENDDANTYNLSDADLEKMNSSEEGIEKDNSSIEKPMSIDQFTDSQIEDIKNIINNQEYDQITSNPYLMSALYYSQKFVKQISNEKYQTSAAKKIMGQVADLIDDDFREGALEALEEQTKVLEKEQGKTISTSEFTPIESIDYGHGINHNDAMIFILKRVVISRLWVQV
ncbi:MAG: hypothetical protein K9M44_04995 [Candidatus Pacebacteria bacterium]|nr:hypothetical protein [Candidatus Paceibacterota bacterium]